MKNLLFIGPYRQKDGWGLASRDCIKAIATTNVNITTRPIYLAPGNVDKDFNDENIIKYENNLCDKYDYVVQHVLPEYFFYDQRFGKNIGLFTLEINDFSQTNVVRNINRMDEIWVPSSVEKNTFIKSGVMCPIKNISMPLDLEQITEYPKFEIHKSINNTFKFYTICENNVRKNLSDLIIAFSLAFSINDPVSLVIKTNGDIRQLQEFADNVRKTLNINKPYRREIWITQRLTDKDIFKLHSSCDCFVMPSYGESFCRPAAEALCLGKNPIINKNIGTKDFINEENGFLVKSHKTPVLLSNHPISGNTDYYNANQYWYKIDIYDLIEKMKQAFNMYQKDIKDWQKKSNIGISQKSLFSYETIGKKLCIQDSQ